MSDNPIIVSDVEKCVDQIIAQVGKDITFGMPLGLGKPIHLVNALYERAKKDSSIKLHIATAITLEKPSGSSKLEKAFMGPFAERLFGGIPDIAYMKDLRQKKLPPNVEVSEFFFKAGSFLNDPTQQQNYISTNYTHAVRDLLRAGVNVVSQMVASRTKDGKTTYSLSCNPDTALDIAPKLLELRAKGKKVAIVAEVNNELPFMINHAEVEPEEFDIILDNRKYDCKLFGAPNMAITPSDHFIGFNASTLVKDGGTLQVGIGSLGSALVNGAIMRHKNNQDYTELVSELGLEKKFPVINEIGGHGTFEKGLYGCSEMMVDGFIYLYKAGILKREVFEDVPLQTLLNEEKITTKVDLKMLDALVESGVVGQELRAKDVTYLKKTGVFKDNVEYKGGSLVVDEETVAANLADASARKSIEKLCLGDKLKGGIIMHGGFFLGPQQFYKLLKELTDEEHEKFCMTSVCFINHLYDHRFGDQKMKLAQRKEARFINSAMMYTLNGAAVSDGLANGKVVSGVGGQYNFVAMAHEIDDARSILTMKSTRQSGGKALSNIVFNYAHCTIPRHLRDIVVTEYGVADLLGRPDKDVYIELIKIADSRFQDELLAQAKAVGKVPADYQLPAEYRQNTPERLMALYKKYSAKGYFDPFPFGCDFTPDELKIGKALKSLKAKTGSRSGLLKAIWGALKLKDMPAEAQPLLKRMNMETPADFKEKLEQKLLVSEMLNLGVIKA
ncbi:MAG: acetyl-CoA hydrolase [Hahellaceae bacterium]|nr:acetyl-CoA hydrolase [Hahellaceae bacterium]MCP5212417.1 acetyl-CoA hydrolase [Hahellaceae bacterium]